MITLDEAVQILTGRKPPLGRRIFEATRSFWLDISHAAAAPFRKVEDAIEGELMIPLSELELYLRRCRRVGYFEQLGIEVPYFEIEGEGIRLLPGDLLAVLTGQPVLEFPNWIAQLQGGADSSQANEGVNG
ncbi:MAG: hypothetical protein WBE36_00930 [Terracidiphilus sp.]